MERVETITYILTQEEFNNMLRTSCEASKASSEYPDDYRQYQMAVTESFKTGNYINPYTWAR